MDGARIGFFVVVRRVLFSIQIGHVHHYFFSRRRFAGFFFFFFFSTT